MPADQHQTTTPEVAQFAGWRAVYGTAAVLIALNAVTLRRALPDHGRQLSISYARQMRGVVGCPPASNSLGGRRSMRKFFRAGLRKINVSLGSSCRGKSAADQVSRESP
jgi:hypothetical protein